MIVQMDAMKPLQPLPVRFRRMPQEANVMTIGVAKGNASRTRYSAMQYLARLAASGAGKNVVQYRCQIFARV